MTDIDMQLGRCEEVLKRYRENSVDLLACDPPYGYKFMGKEWDKVVIPVSIWREILRVMKPGAVGFVMCAPRQDVLSRLIVNLEDSGFKTGFTSIYWTYASGFNKSANASKLADRRMGKEGYYEGNTEPAPPSKYAGQLKNRTIDRGGINGINSVNYVVQTPEGENLRGAYLGYQPKPAIEVICVVMKPTSSGTYIEQAMQDGKGVTWLDDGRIPATNIGERDRKSPAFPMDSPLAGDKQEKNWESRLKSKKNVGNPFAQEHAREGGTWCGVKNPQEEWNPNEKGRFPANLLVSDDVLKHAKVADHPAGNRDNITQVDGGEIFPYGGCTTDRDYHGHCDSYSDYFSLDRWWDRFVDKLPADIRETFPFIAVPKPVKKEKERGLARFGAKPKPVLIGATRPVSQNPETRDKNRQNQSTISKNPHPTIKPVQLFTYLLTIGSRPRDLVLDPFAGSGTTGIAAKLTKRRALLVEMVPKYFEVMKARIDAIVPERSLAYFGGK